MESVSAVQRLSTHCRRSSASVGASDGEEERSTGALKAFDRCAAQPKGIDRPTAERYGRPDGPTCARTLPRMRTPAHPYILPFPCLDPSRWLYPPTQRSALPISL